MIQWHCGKCGIRHEGSRTRYTEPIPLIVWPWETVKSCDAAYLASFSSPKHVYLWIFVFTINNQHIQGIRKLHSIISSSAWILMAYLEGYQHPFFPNCSMYFLNIWLSDFMPWISYCASHNGLVVSVTTLKPTRQETTYIVFIIIIFYI